MARTDARSILSAADEDQLAESYGAVVQSIQKGAVSERFKNTEYSGDATSGSVEVSRFVNATVQDQGTARAAGEGNVLNNKGKVTINVDTDKEIVEEVSNKDIALRGIPNIVEGRRANHGLRLVADLDRTFFAVAEAAASAVTLTGITAIEDQIEAVIPSIETTVNDYVDGVDRELIQVALKPNAYGKIRTKLDTIIGHDGEEILGYHGVEVVSNTRQTADIVAMVHGAVGQLVLLEEYEAERIPLSNETAIELFYSRGTKAVTPDLIKKATITPEEEDTTPEQG